MDPDRAVPSGDFDPTPRRIGALRAAMHAPRSDADVRYRSARRRASGSVIGSEHWVPRHR
jgi:hypothetical protein